MALRPARTTDQRQALPGNPAGQRRLTVQGSPARTSGVSEPAATTARTAVAAVITVVDVAAVTVATVAPLGRSDRRDHRDRRDRPYRCAAGMRERPAQRVRQLCRFVDDKP